MRRILWLSEGSKESSRTNLYNKQIVKKSTVKLGEYKGYSVVPN